LLEQFEGIELIDGEGVNAVETGLALTDDLTSVATNARVESPNNTEWILSILSFNFVVFTCMGTIFTLIPHRQPKS
jgi:hypothetical protein